MAEQSPREPPPGFVLHPPRGGFSTHNGPYFQKPHCPPGTAEQAFFVEARHANLLGVAHGGMLSAFMDVTLASALFSRLDRAAVTVHLSIDFLHMARMGSWVFAHAHVTRVTRDLAFAEGRAFLAGGQDVVRASGVFKLMGRAKASERT